LTVPFWKRLGRPWKIVAISEVLGAHDDHVDLQDIFVFERTGLTDDGKVQGRFKCVCKEPKILERLRVAGIRLDPKIFDEVVDINM